jgi:integron integrase
VRAALRAKHYSPNTEAAYVTWIRRFIVYHQKRHPETLGASDVNAFLTHLATERRVSASTQNRACSAVLFLYGEVLGRPLPEFGPVVRATRPARLPVVLTRGEVDAVLRRLAEPCALMAAPLYGSGLRLLECCTLRVKDVDFERSEILVRDGKGRRDRVTMLPGSLRPRLAAHLRGVKALHQADLAAGAGSVALPDALGVKYPRAPREWGWQWVFPATRSYVDRASGVRRRHHLHESVLQRAFKDCRAGVGPDEAGELPLAAALVRHVPARARLRYPDDPGAARTPGRGDDDGVNARVEPGWARGEEPAG